MVQQGDVMGGRVLVSTGEFRQLATTAARTSAEIESALARAGTLVAGLDGRGWDVFRVYGLWSQVRAQWQHVHQSLRETERRLLQRAELARQLESWPDEPTTGASEDPAVDVGTAFLGRTRLTPDEERVLWAGGVALGPRSSVGTHRLREATQYEEILEASLTVAETARRLNIGSRGVRQRLASRSLYGVKRGVVWRLPRFQFTDHGLVPGFGRVAPELAGVDLVSAMRWFIEPHIDLVVNDGPGRERTVSPRTWLELGRSADMVVSLAMELQGIA